MEKRPAPASDWVYPAPGERRKYVICSADQGERFLLDLFRSKPPFTKCSFQTRARTRVVLARLDLSGPPHTNPDRTRVGTPHLHVYKEGYNDRWAHPLPFGLPDADPARLLVDFLRYCNIVDYRIQLELF